MLDTLDARLRLAGGRRCIEQSQRVTKRSHAEIVVDERAIGAVEPVEERGDLEHARPVLDEVFVDELSARLW